MKRTALILAFSLSALATSAGATMAADAYVTRDADVYANRSGSRVVNDVEEGDIVDVRECSRSANRCFIRIPGRDGWIRASRLAMYDDRSDDYVPFRFGVTIGGPGSGFSFSINP